MEKMVVIGGNAAGMSAATKVRRGDANLPITVFESSQFVTYGSCGLPYYISEDIKEYNDLVTFTPEFLKRERNIDVKIRHQVMEIDPREKFLGIKDLNTGEEFKQYYTKLVIATGASPVLPPIQGIGYKNIFTLRSVEDGIEIKQLLQSGKIKNVAILGAGFIGLEMAEAFRKRNIQVSVFEKLPQVLPQIDLELSAIIESELIKNGVKLYKNIEVVEFEASNDGKVKSLRLKDNRIFDADMVLLAVGVKPNTELAIKAGIQTGLKGCIVVDQYMRSSIPNVWACGDCTMTYNRITREPLFIPLGTIANKQGKIVGENVLGGQAVFPGVLGTQVTKIFDLFVASTGLTKEQALASGFEPVQATIKHWDRAGYYPGTQSIWVTIIMDKNHGKILGAQLVGSEGVAKRIDVFVTAITVGMTVYELNELDLAYAPSVSPVYDPILIAATIGIKAIKN